MITTGFFPHAVASSTIVAAVASLVSGPRTISARRITAGGDAQCQPITSSGRLVAPAICPIGNPDVFDARIVPAGAAASRSRNTCCLSSSFSGTASITTSTLAASSNDAVNDRRAARGVGVLARQLAALDAPLEPVAPGRDVLLAARECVGVDVVTDGLVPRGRRHLRDPRAHHSRSENSDLHPCLFCRRVFIAPWCPQCGRHRAVNPGVGVSLGRAGRCGPARGRAHRARWGWAASPVRPTGG